MKAFVVAIATIILFANLVRSAAIDDATASPPPPAPAGRELRFGGDGGDLSTANTFWWPWWGWGGGFYGGIGPYGGGWGGGFY